MADSTQVILEIALLSIIMHDGIVRAAVVQISLRVQLGDICVVGREYKEDVVHLSI